MLDLLKYIKYFYQSIPYLYGDKRLYIMKKDDMWTVSPDNCQEVVLFCSKNSQDLLQYCIRERLDLNLLETLVRGDIAAEGALRMMQLKKVEELVGKELVQATHEGYQQMGKQIADIIRKPKLELID